VNGALRADYSGQADRARRIPTINQFFNTGAFSVPLTRRFGDSPRATSSSAGIAAAERAVVTRHPAWRHARAERADARQQPAE
jgi:hypothetical protein